VYDANSDEHLPDGSLTEETPFTQQMYDKRLRKHKFLLEKLPEPELYGPDQASLTLVGWGSVKNTVLDAISLWNEQHPESVVNYLNYEYVYPVKTDRFMSVVKKAQKVVLIENNALGQLGALLTQHTGYLFTQSWLKYDGRPFFIEDLMQHFEKEFDH
jgi:2-oxoglutarate ferredoxin oxidoreductase subunit alpha